MSQWLFHFVVSVIAVMAAFLMIYPLGLKRRTQQTVFIVIIGLIIGGYYQWGSYISWHEKTKENLRLVEAKEMMKKLGSPEKLITKFKEKLQQDPSDPKGWYLLGRIYSGQAQWQNAQEAFARAYALKPEDETYHVNYVFSLWQVNGQKMNESIRSQFTDLLKVNPHQPDAIAMLAMDSFQQKKYSKAIIYWQQLLKQTPPDSEASQTITRAIRKAESMK